jgi:hypothetical protein
MQTAPRSDGSKNETQQQIGQIGNLCSSILSGLNIHENDCHSATDPHGIPKIDISKLEIFHLKSYLISDSLGVH